MCGVVGGMRAFILSVAWSAVSSIWQNEQNGFDFADFEESESSSGSRLVISADHMS